MKNNNTDFQTIFQALPGNYLILKPHLSSFIITAVSDQYLEATFTKREDIVGRDIFEVFPDNPTDACATSGYSLTRSLQTVLRKKSPDEMRVQKYGVPLSENNNFA